VKDKPKEAGKGIIEDEILIKEPKELKTEPVFSEQLERPNCEKTRKTCS